MIIDQKTITEFMQLGGQYFLPVAALLRAIYSGIRGKFPEGFSQIAVASLFAGLTAAVGNEQLDIRSIALKILGNTVFMAGLLSFIMTYLLRQPFRSLTIDGIIGGVIGLIAWLVWVGILLNPWPWWTFPAGIVVGAAGFIALRLLLKQIFRLVRIATGLIVTGVFLVLGAGAILVIQQIYVMATAK